MRNRKPFLTAHWLDLAMISCRVDPALLRPHLPPGCELDLFDGHAMASIVAFDFFDTRVMGIRWPGFVRFPEINLRFYVRHGDEHGVCFVREFVGLRAVACVARAVFNEPYRVAPLQSVVTKSDHQIRVEYRLNFGRQTQRIGIVAANETICPGDGTLENFLKDQQFGFGTSRRGKLIRYQVTHPTWRIHPVRTLDLDWNWAAVYGPAWAGMQSVEPSSVMLVEGSGVELYPHEILNPYTDENRLRDRTQAGDVEVPSFQTQHR